MSAERAILMDLREDVEYIHSTLVPHASDRGKFDSMAGDLARDYGTDPVLIRAIGLGSIPTSLEVSKRTKFVMHRYVNEARNDAERQIRTQRMAHLFGIAPGSVSSYVAWVTMEDAQKEGQKENPTEKPAEVEAEPVSKQEPRRKNSRHLSKEVKARICGYVELGETEEEKRILRQEMADTFWVTNNVIGAITAHVKIRAKRAAKEAENAQSDPVSPQISEAEIKDEKLPSNSLAPEDIEFVQEYIANEPNLEAQKKAQAELATSFEVPLEEIERLTSDLLKPPATLPVSEEKADDSQPAERMECAEEETPEALNGAHIEYNNEIKNEWRKKMREFLEERTTPEERAKMKVLCLPGRQWLEVEHVYLALGFRPENIIGVEREASVRAEFEQNAEQLGCQAHFGDLQDFLERYEGKFDVVSLDFLGPVSIQAIKIFNRLKISERAFVLTNFQGKRENKAQDCLHAVDGMVRKFTTGFQQDVGALEDIKNSISLQEQGIESPRQLEAVRDDTFCYLIHNTIPRNHNPRYVNRLERLSVHKRFHQLQAASADLADTLEKLLIRFGHPKSWGVAIYLANIFLRSVTYDTHLVSVEKYRYMSKSGNRTTPFVSDFLELRVPTELYGQTKCITQFMLECMEYYFTTPEGEKFENRGQFYLVATDGTRVTNRKVDPTDTLIFKTPEKEIALPLLMYYSEVKAYRNACMGNMMDRTILSREDENPPRKEISIDRASENIQVPASQNDEPSGNTEKVHTDVEILPPEQTGAHIEYNNEVKNRWRDKMKEFITERIPEKERAKMRVLCLPGRAWLEVEQVYLPLGFSPKNIIGVEREPSVRKEFEQNAVRLGCQAHFGDLKEFLGQDKTPFDVVSLDFLGPMCEAYLEIAEHISVNQRAWVMLNMQARREKTKTQKELQYMHGQLADFDADFAMKSGAYGAFKHLNDVGKSRVNDPEALKEVRETSLALAFESALSKRTRTYHEKTARMLRAIRPDLLPEGIPVTDPRIQDVMISYAGQLADSLGKMLSDASSATQKWEEMNFAILNMFIGGIVRMKQIVHLQKFQYVSEGEKRNTPFVSDFFELRGTDNFSSNVRHTNNFLLASINGVLEARDKSRLGRLEMIFCDKKGTKKASRFLKRSDLIKCFIDGQSCAEISLGRILGDISAYVDYSANVVGSFDDKFKTPRRDI